MTTTSATDKVDVVEVIQKYVTLEVGPDGTHSYKGRCPFCHTPSFYVTQGGEGLYHCFGCGDGGDATRFLQRVSPLQADEQQQNVRTLLDDLTARKQDLEGRRDRVKVAMLDYLGEKFGADVVREIFQRDDVLF